MPIPVPVAVSAYSNFNHSTIELNWAQPNLTTDYLNKEAKNKALSYK